MTYFQQFYCGNVCLNTLRWIIHTPNFDTPVFDFNRPKRLQNLTCHSSHFQNNLSVQPVIGQRPLMIFSYLGFSLFVSGFIMTVLAYAPTDSYLMVMIQEIGVMGFLGPIVLVVGCESCRLELRLWNICLRECRF